MREAADAAGVRGAAQTAASQLANKAHWRKLEQESHHIASSLCYTSVNAAAHRLHKEQGQGERWTANELLEAMHAATAKRARRARKGSQPLLSSLSTAVRTCMSLSALNARSMAESYRVRACGRGRTLRRTRWRQCAARGGESRGGSGRTHNHQVGASAGQPTGTARDVERAVHEETETSFLACVRHSGPFLLCLGIPGWCLFFYERGALMRSPCAAPKDCTTLAGSEIPGKRQLRRCGLRT